MQYFGLSNPPSKFSKVVLRGVRFCFKKEINMQRYTMKAALKSTASSPKL